jgi:uncharacterized SAM-binding protein YcdF (DUF218 family)
LNLFYHVSKVAWFVLEPSNLITLVLGIGLLLSLASWRAGLARAGRALALLAIVTLGIVGLSPLANLLIVPLETRFPVPDLGARTVDGIIVLGGALQERPTVTTGLLTFNEAGERLTALAMLARRYPQARVVFSGGSGFWTDAPASEGALVARHLGDLGLAADRVIIEDRSRNTWENAVFSQRLIGQKPGETWLLVTSAWHMPRAVGIFRQVGWPVIPYPVDHRTDGWPDLTRGFSSVSEGLRRTDIAAREWVGLIVYRLTGRSTAVLPGP